jgi:hypothetical protein
MRLRSVDDEAAETTQGAHDPRLLTLLRGLTSPGGEDDTAPAGLAAARYGVELAAFAAMACVPRPAAHLLAAHAAGSFLAVQPAAVRQAEPRTPLAEVCEALAGGLPADEILDGAWQVLHPGGTREPLDRSMPTLQRLWPLAASAENLLVQGGDERLSLDPVTGLNRYLCSPMPRPDVLAFGSCTASSISAPGLRAAERCRRALLLDAAGSTAEGAIERATHATASRLLDHFGIADLADAMLVASGTDAALLVTALIAARHPGQALTSILMSPAETGSGVPEAVQGRHFSTVTASGRCVPKAGALDGIAGPPALLTVALRDADGRPRPMAAVSHACTAAVAQAAARGPVVLHAIDGSKTGLTAPGWDTCRALLAEHGAKLSVVIDACQVRIDPSVVRAYLHAGCTVLVTGSKFFAAPGFCGAVLAPRGMAGSLPVLPRGVLDYATGADGLVARRCPGLLLRWAAALYSMERFAAVPDGAVAAAIGRMARAVRAALAENPRLLPVEAPLRTGPGWSARASVLSFAVQSRTGVPLPANALRTLYIALASDSSGAIGTATEDERALAAMSCQIGQPVTLGSPMLGALRIAFSADQLAEGGAAATHVATIFAKLRLLLDRGCGDSAQA